jgi:hypothetical protein
MHRSGGFDWTRRMMPITVRGPLNSDTSSTYYKVLHSAVLECTIEGLDGPSGFREMVRGKMTDQHYAEAKVARAPYGKWSRDATGKLDLRGVRAAIDGIRARESSVQDHRNSMYFLPKALEVKGTLHILNNAIRRAIEESDEWNLVRPIIDGLVSLIGHSETKDCVF